MPPSAQPLLPGVRRAGSACTPPSSGRATPDRPPLGTEIGSPVVSPLLTRRLVRGIVLGSWHEATCSSPYPVAIDDVGLPDFALLEDGEDPDLMSVGESVFNLVNTMVGSGVLSVPYAFRLAGYAALPLLCAVVAVTAFTAALIGEALDLAAGLPGGKEVPRQDRDYAFLAHMAFGSLGRKVVAGIATLELWLAVVTLLVMNGVNAYLLFGAEPQSAIVACAIAAVMMVRIPMRAYAYISLVSLTMLFGASCAFLCYLLQLQPWAYPPVGIPSTDPGNVPRAVGIMLFCFAGHPCFPNVHEHMHETDRWNESVGVSFFLSIVYYGGLGMLSYSALGPELQPSFVMNIAERSMWHGVVALLFLVKVQLTLPLLLRAILISTNLMWEPKGVAVLIAVTAGSACLFAKDMAALATLCGSLLVMMTSVLIPVVLYLRLWSRAPSGDGVGVLLVLTCLVVVLFGCCAGASGTYFAVADLAAGWPAVGAA